MPLMKASLNNIIVKGFQIFTIDSYCLGVDVLYLGCFHLIPVIFPVCPHDM